MKSLIMLLLATGAIMGGYAQAPKIVPGDSLLKKIATRNLVSPHAKLVNELRNGDKVYVLPVDGMICIVPNPSFYNYKMPILKGEIKGYMPNAAPRLQLIPNKSPTPIR